jgi:hypothetical protein
MLGGSQNAFYHCSAEQVASGGIESTRHGRRIDSRMLRDIADGGPAALQSWQIHIAIRANDC